MKYDDPGKVCRIRGHRPEKTICMPAVNYSDIIVQTKQSENKRAKNNKND